jgi:hypothetical protein
MDFSVALGVMVGMLIGGTYAWLQLSALRKNAQRQREQAGTPSVAGIVPGSLLRVGLLLASLVAVQVLVPAEYKTTRFYWSLTISLALTYGVPFFWKLKDMMSRNK